MHVVAVVSDDVKTIIYYSNGDTLTVPRGEGTGMGASTPFSLHPLLSQPCCIPCNPLSPAGLPVAGNRKRFSLSPPGPYCFKPPVLPACNHREHIRRWHGAR